MLDSAHQPASSWHTGSTGQETGRFSRTGPESRGVAAGTIARRPSGSSGWRRLTRESRACLEPSRTTATAADPWRLHRPSLGRQLRPARNLPPDTPGVRGVRCPVYPARDGGVHRLRRAARRRPGRRDGRCGIADPLHRLRSQRRDRTAGPVHLRAGDTADSHHRRPPQRSPAACPARVREQARRARQGAARGTAAAAAARGDLVRGDADQRSPGGRPRRVRRGPDQHVRRDRGTHRPHRPWRRGVHLRHRHLHRRVCRRRWPAGARRHHLSPGPGHQPAQSDSAADPLRADRQVHARRAQRRRVPSRDRRRPRR